MNGTVGEKGGVRPKAVLVGVAAVIAAGVALRAWILLSSPLGTLDADEASVGLIARHFLNGEFSVFVWGQPYGGNQEAALSALAFALSGSGTLQLKLVEVALFALGTVFVWRAGILAVGRRAAALGALLLCVWPGFLVFWSTKANGYYGFSFLCVAIAMLLVFRLRERDSFVDAALLGLVLGQGIWASLAVAAVTLPFVVWLVVRRPAVLRLAVVAVPVLLISAGPALVWNAMNGWATLAADPHHRETTPSQRLEELFTIVVPSWFGFRTPYSLEWVAGRILGIASLGVMAIAFAVLALRRPRQTTPLVLCCATYPLFYVSSPFAGYVTAPKYLVPLAPAIALLAGYALARHRLLPLLLVVAVAASLGTLLKMESWELYRWRAPDRPVPADIGPLLTELERLGVTRVRADQALAPRITFESEEEIIAAGGFTRYRPHERLVAATRWPAYVFVRGSRTEVEQSPGLLQQGYERHEADGFVIMARS